MRRARVVAFLCVLVALAAIGATVLTAQKSKPKFNTWRAYLGGADSSQYSSLDQINKKNVAQLQVAWTYSPGDQRTYRFNPIVIDGVMYTLGKGLAVIALDAASGKELWIHESQGAVGDRGMNYW